MPINWTSQQKDAIERLNKRILVSASAGSGKTSVMVARVLDKLLKERVDIDDMLIVTFTRKAASDMREKLTKELFAAIESSESSRFLIEQIEKLPTANICTIHSYCQSLISRYFYKLNLGTPLDILDDGAAITAAFSILEKMFNKKLGQAEFCALYNLFLNERKDYQLKHSIYSIYTAAMKEREPFVWLDNALNIYNDYTPILEYNKKSLAKIADFYRQRVGALTLLARQKGFKKAEEYLNLLDENLSLKQVISFTMHKKQLAPEQTAFIDSFSDLKKEVMEFVRDAQGLLVVEDNELSKQLASSLIELAKEFALEFNEYKRNKNIVQYSDLEQYAHSLLTKQGVKERFKYVFVDEYQDVSPIQDSICEELCRDASAYFVGDIKQSIYSFRLCKPQIFLDKFKDLEIKANGGALRFNNNFRSRNQILRFCNTVFCSLMTEDFGRVNYEKEAQLKGGLNKEGGVVEFLLVRPKVQQQEQGPEIYSVRDAENTEESGFAQMQAHLCAAKINSLLGKEIEEDGKKRLWRAGDIAILLRANEHISTFKRVLESYDIPVSAVIKGAKQRQGREIEALISILKLIDNMRQDIALIEALKSFVFGFTDSQLLYIRRVGDYIKDMQTSAYEHISDAAFTTISEQQNTFYAAARRLLCACADSSKRQELLACGAIDCLDEHQAGQTITRLERAFTELKQWFELSQRLDVPQLVSKIIEQTDYFGLVASLPNGVAREEALEGWLAEINTSFKGVALPAYIQWLKEEGALDNSDYIPSSQNAVSIMTMHSAKGLEFNAVFLCGLQQLLQGSKRQGGLSIVIDSDYGLGINYYDEDEKEVLDSFVLRSLTKKIKDREREENLRLLYVSLTRAKEHLYMVASNVNEAALNNAIQAHPSQNKSFIEWLWYAKNVATTTFIDYDEVEKTCIKSKARPLLSQKNQEFMQKLNEYIGFEYPYRNDLKLKSNVTALNDEAFEGMWQNDAESEEYKDALQARAASAIETGNAYHAFMQHMQFSKNINIQQQASQLQAYGLLNSYALSLVDLGKIECALKNSLFDGIENKKIMRECKFILNQSNDNEQNMLVQGIIDLVIFDDDGAVLVDYKTTKASQAQLCARYGEQMRLYAEALQKIKGIHVKRRVIYSFYLNKAVDL